MQKNTFLEENKQQQNKSIMAVDTNDEYEYIRMEGMMDFGAFDTISPIELLGGNKIRETEMSKNGDCYSACNVTSLSDKER